MSSTTDHSRSNRHRRIGVYIAFVLWTVALVWRMESQHDHAIHRVQEESEARAEQVKAESDALILALCERGNESRQGIREFVLTLVLGDGEGEVTPRQQQVIDETERRFAQKPCPPGDG